jgi:hypothetical protein
MSKLSRWLLGSLLAVLCCAFVGLCVAPAHVSSKRHGRATRGMDCAVCHTAEGWKVRADLAASDQKFDHDLTGFPLRAGHARAACTQCHDGRKTIERSCSSCHADAHGGKLGKACDSCHTVASFQRTDAFALHSRTRLPLTGMHVLVDCADCHRRMSSDGFSNVPSQCFACHEQDYRRPDVHPAHDGSDGAAPFPRNCAECHRTDAFSPAVVDAGRFLGAQSDALMLDVRAHDRRFVVSRGPHQGAACASCHVQMREPRMVRCTGCHAHGTQKLAAQHPRMATPGDGSCMGCHPGGFAR